MGTVSNCKFVKRGTLKEGLAVHLRYTHALLSLVVHYNFERSGRVHGHTNQWPYQSVAIPISGKTPEQWAKVACSWKCRGQGHYQVRIY